MSAPAVSIAGELTIMSAAERRGELFEALEAVGEGQALALDLAQVTELDTAGLQLLLLLKREAAAHAVVLRVTEVSEAVREVLAIVRLSADLAYLPIDELALSEDDGDGEERDR